MNAGKVPEIDGGALARVPLIEIENAIRRTLPGSTLRQSLKAVIRALAVELVAGTVPDGMAPADAFRRGRDLLALLNSNVA